MIYSRLLLILFFFSVQQAVGMERDSQEALDRDLYHEAVTAIVCNDIERLKAVVTNDIFKSRDLINKSHIAKSDVEPLLSLATIDVPNSSKIVQYLLQQGARVNGQDSNRRTALCRAIRYRDNSFFNGERRSALDTIIKLLLNNDADPAIADNGGFTPIRYVNDSILIQDTPDEQDKELLADLKNAEIKLRTKELYGATFVSAYRYRIAGFAGLVLPRDMVNPEILQWVTAPPYTQQEIDDGLTKTAEEYTQKTNQN